MTIDKEYQGYLDICEQYGITPVNHDEFCDLNVDDFSYAERCEDAPCCGCCE